MMEIGRLCVKIAGRDAGMKCVIVDKIDDTFVLIDGETRRRKCNVKHLEPLGTVMKLEKGASTTHVKVAFKKLKLEVRETKPKKTADRPLKVRKGKAKDEKTKSVRVTAETKDKVKKEAKVEKTEKKEAKTEEKKEKAEKKEAKKIEKKAVKAAKAEKK
ncbi:MAG: 50S ribosomal protein L14e [archaeon]